MPDLQAKVQRLGEGVSLLANDVEALTSSVATERNWRRALTVAMAAAAAIFFALVSILVYLALQNHRLLDEFNSCTTAGTPAKIHACYDRGQKAQADAVSALQKSNIKASAYAVECVLAGRSDVEDCVNDRFAGAPRPAPVAPPPSATPSTSKAPAAFVTRGAAASPTTTTWTPPRSSVPPPVVPVPVTTPPVNPCLVKLNVFCIHKPGV